MFLYEAEHTVKFSNVPWKAHSQVLETILDNWNHLNDEKLFLFHIKNSFCFQDI